jgi:hypothetical protein
MKKYLNSIFYIILLFAVYQLVHEGIHIITSTAFGEFDTVRWNVLGPAVIYKTPVDHRVGARWAVIAGTSNLATILIGYLLLYKANVLSQIPSLFAKGFFYYLTLTFLCLDALNLSVGPFVYGGDAVGVAFGLGVNLYLIQAVFFIVFLVNRELVAKKLLPAYGVETDHIALRPWFKRL